MMTLKLLALSWSIVFEILIITLLDKFRLVKLGNKIFEFFFAIELGQIFGSLIWIVLPNDETLQGHKDNWGKKNNFPGRGSSKIT